MDTSDYSRHYPGPGSYYYNIYSTTPGATIENGGVVPAGYDAYVRARRYEIAGTFETTNNAFYLEDNWNITPDFLLNAGLRRDAFDNKTGEGASYIKMDNMIAPRLGFSWDLKGDGTTKIFGNLGRYYLPVANVINIKQAGGLLDQRTYYAFDGYQILDRNGSPYAMPILGPQIGPVDDSQGNGTVGDLRAEVDKNMDSVYQDEAILGFQQAITDKWSWGVSGTYRRLHNAIDDMEISATPQCGGDGYIGYVMGNPGRKLTVYGDTNCDGVPDGYINIDTSKQGWAMYDADGNYLGQRGWKKPRRSFGSLEFQIDRAWDEKWMLNASYVLSWSRGNAEGPVNSDTNFDDTGRTENFDDPWVNLQWRLPAQRPPPPVQDPRHLRDQQAVAGRRRPDGICPVARSRGMAWAIRTTPPFTTAISSAWRTAPTRCPRIASTSARHAVRTARRGPSTSTPASPTCCRWTRRTTFA